MNESSVNEPQLLNSIQQLKRTYDHSFFAKCYQTQITFIEKTIRLGQVGSYSLCRCFGTRDTAKQEESRFIKYNSVFCDVFTNLSTKERLEYYLCMLEYMEEVNILLHGVIQLNFQNGESKFKQLKAYLLRKLTAKFISKQLKSMLDISSAITRFDISVAQRISGFKVWRQRVAQIIHCKLQIGTDTESVFNVSKLDLRNYILRKSKNSSPQRTDYCLLSIYDSQPNMKIKFFFRDVETEKQHIIIMSQIVKLGFLQRVIRAVNMDKIFPKGRHQEKIINPELKNLSSIMLGNIQDFTKEDEEFNFIESKLEKQKQIKAQEANHRRSQLKQKLIVRLDQIAALKNQENLKEQIFMSHRAIKDPKPKSKILKNKFQNLSLKTATLQFFPFYQTEQNNFQSQHNIKASERPRHQKGQLLSISVATKNAGKNNKLYENEQSLSLPVKDSRRLAINPETILPLSLAINENDSCLFHHRDLFRHAYPNYDLQGIQNVFHFENITITPQLYQFSVKGQQFSVNSQQMNQKDHDRIFRSLKDCCKVYQNTAILGNYKIFFEFKESVQIVLKILLDIESWPCWHTNVVSGHVLLSDLLQNSLEYDLICESSQRKRYKMLMRRHLFSKLGQYFIVDQPVKQPIESYFKQYYNWLTKIEDRSFQFCLWKIEKGTIDKTTNVVCDVQLNIKSGRQDSLMLLTNFFYMIDLKLHPKWNQFLKKPSLLDLRWTVSDNECSHPETIFCRSQTQQKLPKSAFYRHISNDFSNSIIPTTKSPLRDYSDPPSPMGTTLGI